MIGKMQGNDVVANGKGGEQQSRRRRMVKLKRSEGSEVTYQAEQRHHCTHDSMALRQCDLARTIEGDSTTPFQGV